MRTLRLLEAVALLTVAVQPSWAVTFRAAPGGDDRFHSQTAGFTITKPSSWVFATAEQIVRNRETVRLKDKEIQDLVRQRASMPIVAITKHPEPYGGLNASVQVVLRPLGKLEGMSAVELMKVGLPTLRRGVAGFKFVEAIRATSVSGRDAATAKFTYTVGTAGGERYAVLSRMWMIPRGKLLFTVGMSGPPEGDDLSEEEFAAILESITIED